MQTFGGKRIPARQAMEPARNGHQETQGRPKVHLVGIHSFRGGAGKTTLAANLAFLAARGGAKVALLDADLQAPSLHTALGVGTKRILHSVSEFVREQCELREVPIDLSLELGLDGTEGPQGKGSLHFLPSSTDLQTATSILFEGYDVGRLNEHLLALAKDMDLDYLFLDTHLGINRETLLSLAISDTVLVLLRPDGQDHVGAGVLVRIAQKVGVPQCLLVPNMVGAKVDQDAMSEEFEKDLGAPVAGILPWCSELSELGCKGLFAVKFEDHPLTAQLDQIVQRLTPARATPGGGS